MPKQRSRYDELHDRYYELLSTKSGTRYRVNASSYQRIFETPSSRKSGVEI